MLGYLSADMICSEKRTAGESYMGVRGWGGGVFYCMPYTMAGVLNREGLKKGDYFKSQNIDLYVFVPGCRFLLCYFVFLAHL